MPKANFLQRKNKSSTSAGGDFKRLKAKVGKRVAKPVATDTSFRSKRVCVSAQSILAERGDGVVGSRGQSVETLLAQLKHYSATVRREAFEALTAVVEANAGYAESHFIALAEPSLEAVLCEDGSVRKAFLAYQAALLRVVPASALSPFADRYVAYVASAMTSLDAGIREDSLSFAALLLDRFPAVIAARAGRLLPNYSALITAGPSGLRRKARGVALATLRALLAATAGAGTAAQAGGPSAGDAAVVADVQWTAAGRNGIFLLRLPRKAVAAEGLDAGGGAGAAPAAAAAAAAAALAPGASSSTAGAFSASSAATPAVLREQAKPLLSRLQEAWMEAAGDESSAPDITQLQAVAEVLLALLPHPALAAAEGDGAAAAALRAWCAQFMPLLLAAFPIAVSDGVLQSTAAADAGASLRLALLNATLCEVTIVAAAAVASAPGGADRRSSSSKAAAGGGSAAAAAAAAGWLLPVLRHCRAALDSATSATGNPATDPVATAAFASIIRVLREVCLTNKLAIAAGSGGSGGSSGGGGSSGSGEAALLARREALAAFGCCFETLSGSREARRICIGFACDFALAALAGNSRGSSAAAAAAYNGAAGSAEAEEEAVLARQWLRALPALLTTWGADQPQLTAKAVLVLLEVAKRAPLSPAPGIESQGGNGLGSGGNELAAAAGVESERATCQKGEPVEWLALALAPFFASLQFRVLDPAVQRRAAALLYHLPALPAPLLETLESLCADASWGDGGVRGLILEAVHHKRRLLRPSEYLGFLLAVLTGSGAADDGDVGAGGCGGRSVSRRESSKASGKRRRGEPGGSAVAAAAASAAAVSPWAEVLKRDAIAAGVCDVLSRAGGKAVDALLPALSQLLEGCCDDGGGGGSSSSSSSNQRKALRGARLALLCLVGCGHPEHLQAALLGAMAKAIAWTLGVEVPAAYVTELRRPAMGALLRWPPLLPAALEVLAAAAVATAAKDGQRHAEPLLKALLVLLRAEELREQLETAAVGPAVTAAASVVGEAFGEATSGPLVALARQIEADARLLVG